MKERFESRRLTGDVKVACKFDDGTVRYWEDRKEQIVSRIIAIVKQYSSQGYRLTLRQLHYQLVSRNWIVNHDSAYKKLGNILDDCRYAGMIDWDAIEDRGRQPFIPYFSEDIADALDDTHRQYRIDRMQGQSQYIELWTEKDALSGILRRVTSRFHIQLVVNKGYTSSSAIYGSYKRIAERILKGQKAVVLYFGDHDPSGLDMIRDIRDRLMLFLTRGESLKEMEKKVDDWWYKEGWHYVDIAQRYDVDQATWDAVQSENDSDRRDKAIEQLDAYRIQWFIEEHNLFEVIGIGLTMAQIKQHNLPPNPTKMTDSRADGYVKKYGRTCWEVDALNPDTLTEIVTDEITGRIDKDQFDLMIEREKNERDEIKKLIDQYGGTASEDAEEETED